MWVTIRIGFHREVNLYREAGDANFRCDNVQFVRVDSSFVNRGAKQYFFPLRNGNMVPTLPITYGVFTVSTCLQ